MLAATANITAVAIRPRIFCGSGNRTEPVIFLLAVISIITNMIGAAVTPLITALQKSALIGLIPTKFNATPSSVATNRIPRICRDAAGIVVGRTGYDSGTEFLKGGE
jgi:hypothetical protein